MRLNIPMVKNSTRQLTYRGTCKDNNLFNDQIEDAHMINAAEMVKPSILKFLNFDVIPPRVEKCFHMLKYEEDYTLGVSLSKTIFFLNDIRKDLHYFWTSDLPINTRGHLDLGLILDRGVDKYVERGEH